MESLLLRGLESTLRYWLRTFSREQFRLRGRSIQLYDLDVDGDALHASLGLPPTLQITEARIRNLELRIASITNVHREPIVAEIDELELTISEKLYSDLGYIPGGLPSSSSGDAYGYGYSDKLADGMTLRIGRVHMLLETKGVSHQKGAATWIPPVASITITNLELFTTDERWQIVPLNQARDFSINKGAIYVFKKLFWESLSLDLLPPKSDHIRSNSTASSHRHDNDERMQRGERILDKVSGCGFITVQRTEMNIPSGLEVRIHVPEILSSRISEPGLQALLRFVTGVFICMSREEANVRSFQSVDEAARTVIVFKVDQVFLSVKDIDFQMELLMKNFQYVRANVVEQKSIRAMTQIMVGSLFLRDIAVQPSCMLVQPSVNSIDPIVRPPVPAFASEKQWPKIHPFESWLLFARETTPMLCVYSSQVKPSPVAPALATQLVVQCQPLKIVLQEATCLRIALLLSESVVLESTVKLPDRSLHAAYLTFKEFDLTIPVNGALMDEADRGGPFTGIRIYISGFMMANSPFLTFRMLDLDNDPACSSIWKGQPVHSSHQRWILRASNATIALETDNLDDSVQKNAAAEADRAARLWHCVEMSDLGVEAAMLSGDGEPLMTFLPSGGIVRLGLSCKKCVAYMTYEQYSFVLKLYRLSGGAVEALNEMSKSFTSKDVQMNFEETSSKKLLDIVPVDTAVVLRLSSLDFRLLATVPGRIGKEGPTLAKLLGWEVFLSVTHKKLAGAAMVTSKLQWLDIQVECVEFETYQSEGECSSKQALKNHVSSSESSSRSPDSSVLSSTSSSRASSTKGEPAGLPDKEAFLEEQTNFESASYILCPVIWTGKERGSMVPVERNVGEDEYSAPKTPFMDVNIEMLISQEKQETDGSKLQVIARVGGVRLGGSMCQVESLLQKHHLIGPRGVPGRNIKKLIKFFSDGPIVNMLKPYSMESKGAGVPAMLTSNDNLWPLDIFHILDLDIQFLDWLFSLEGVEVAADSSSKSLKPELKSLESDVSWYVTFRSLQFVGRGTKIMSQISAKDGERKHLRPMQNLTMRIEGLQAVRDKAKHASHFESEYSATNAMGIEKEELPMKKTKKMPDALPNISSTSGCDLELCLVERGNDIETDFGMGNWLMDRFRVGVGEPVQIEGTRQELEDLREICKAEIKAARRMASAVVKLFERETADKIGNEDLDLKLPLPEQQAKEKFPENIPVPRPLMQTSGTEFGKEFDEMEAAILTSQDLCAKISHQMGHIKEDKAFLCWGTKLRSSAPVDELARLQKQLLRMKALLPSLRNGIN
ncbi:uncharacterized protein [Physcomitrium patens]|uniref:Uncharacterized protein n=1 Tax=Physcomitrium patens TaxID=3218 RepID=A0A2K1JC14_PHYPA|nr:uncharacterized protein LOC112292466 [Physcomitrium patens]XP_024396756.1 uncharacterized protein LOC112292466 [Physcomitrium patens]XP_024396757.1 uncharacterized protein LOC112292466 [Physcomitrium patens]XP_024396758.1 uncharacterized protein LOC112292466 [Physcomitrium patens]XP_024396759.1 uncharacterized protein LOC112292466 [Physcomitrium patens]XP_024396760.1 uncharacterized protein LOC112292466 [Physcomitrium patens]PNR39061.1 hypothetical protein PHYPA_019339 [Physcomitrium paten|eukprot:XP_024396755.1 uncharacterized protein LOC112292466 [Physcomitrella patens]